MPGVTREQIDRAKQWDLLSYLQQREPGELKKVPGSSKEYRTITHDSLVISNGKWNWTMRGFGGKTALDYLIKVQGMEFVEAVRTLCGTMGDFKADAPGSDKRFNFCLPSSDPSSGLLAVFESPIDALSLVTLRKVTRHGINAITCHWAARFRWRCCNS